MSIELNKRNQIVDLRGKRVLVGADWSTSKKTINFISSMKVRAQSKKSNLHYGATFTKENQDFFQSALFDISSELDPSSVVVGEKAIAGKIFDWIEKEGINTSQASSIVFIHSIKKTKDSLENPKFWIAYYEKSGEISSLNSSFLEDKEELAEKTSTISWTDEHIISVVTEDDIPSIEFVKSHNSDFEKSITITGEDLSEALESDFGQATRYYKPSSINFKKARPIGLASLLAASSWFGYSYISQQDEVSFFENNETVSTLGDLQSSYRDMSSKVRISKSKWDTPSFRQETLEQFSNSLEKNLYSPIDVPIILKEINKTLPIYAAEWRLTKLTYENNRFFARYDRIPGGKGVYFLLDEQMSHINNVKEGLKIRPYNLVNEGNTRVYQLTPEINLERKKIIISLQDGLREERNIIGTLRETLKSAYDRASDIIAVHEDYKQLGFKERWLERTPVELKVKAEKLTDEFNIIKEKLKENLSAYQNMEPVVLDEKLILGNVMDFVTMMQLDSFFEWSFPSLKRVYPNEKQLKERNDNEESFKAAIESYQVEITTQESDEEGKTRSYGISDMISLGILINKPFVNLDIVEYDKINEQWRFSVHFHRKTEEYEKRIAKD